MFVASHYLYGHVSTAKYFNRYSMCTVITDSGVTASSSIVS